MDPLKEGDTINIGGVQYTISEMTNETNNELSRHDALAKMGVELFYANNIGIGDVLSAEVRSYGCSYNVRYYDTGNTNLDLDKFLNSTAFIDNDQYGTEELSVHVGYRQVKKPLTFNLHAGADAALDNKISVDIQPFDTISLGIQHLNVVNRPGKTGDNGITATYAIDAIADALQKVSDQRAELGAIQNRLEHSIANLDNIVENTTAAESRIRDTDMAEAMVEYSKNNILAQAGQSMLAQANSSAEGVMALLQ